MEIERYLIDVDHRLGDPATHPLARAGGHQRARPTEVFRLIRPTPVYEINYVPPDRMTTEQRRREVASLLALGLVRLRDAMFAQSAGGPAESEFELGFSGNQRLHSHTVNNLHEEAP